MLTNLVPKRTNRFNTLIQTEKVTCRQDANFYCIDNENGIIFISIRYLNMCFCAISLSPCVTYQVCAFFRMSFFYFRDFDHISPDADRLRGMEV